jgi:putative CocE/NonD family hydrolase
MVGNNPETTGLVGRRKPPNQTAVTVERDVEIVMRDGVILRADVYRPADSGRYPVLLGRTCYGKDSWGEWIEPLRTASEGYVVVINDTRGGFASKGRFAPYFDDADDGYDTVEWCGTQEWSNGKVGMFGSSAPGFVQLLAATRRPPHLVAIAPMQTWSNFGHGCVYDAGGGFSMHTRNWALLEAKLDPANRLAPEQPGFRERYERALAAFHDISPWNARRPLSDFPPLPPDVASYLYEWMRHPDDDDYWTVVDIRPRYGEITVPALHLVGWFDRFSRGTVENFVGLRDHAGSELARSSQWLIAGPWVHGLPVEYSVGATYFGSDAWLDARRLVLDWYDYWLKGLPNYIPEMPRVHLFVQGDRAWTAAPSWPHPSAAPQILYLRSDGDAADSNGSLSPLPADTEAADVFTHDPTNPVPSTPGRAERPAGPNNQTAVEARPDVLVYTSVELAADLWVCGQPIVELWAATSAVDTDWVARLVDVAEDGTPTSVCEGMIRARYRDSLKAPKLVIPDEVNKYEIKLLPTSITFRAGHRIRLEVCSSSFPGIDANTGTGDLFSDATDHVVAEQAVHHSMQFASRIVLPAVPTSQRVDEQRRLPRRVE